MSVVFLEFREPSERCNASAAFNTSAGGEIGEVGDL